MINKKMKMCVILKYKLPQMLKIKRAHIDNESMQ